MKTSCDKCGSSDANHVYEDGHTHCFSCNTTTFPNNKSESKSVMKYEPTTYTNTNIRELAQLDSYALTSRGISKEVVEFFGVKMGFDSNRKPASHYYPYTNDGQTVAYKERILPKDFRVHGQFKNIELFGQSLFSGGRTLVIVEGEIDTLSVAQAFKEYKGKIYPVVGLASASDTSAVLRNRDWINSFDDVILMLDKDDAGKKATDAIAKMIKAGKARVAKLPEKDPNETLLKHGKDAILRAVWDAQEWSPAGIVTGEAIWEQFKARQEVESVPYPRCLSGLNEKLGGMRYGEITLFTSGTGSGKSTVIKEIVLDLLENTEERIGLISLEESIGDTAEKFISMSLKRPVNDPPPLTDEELKAGFDKVFGDERLVLLDHQGSVGDDSLIDKIEYMCLMGCKYLILDHITIAVSEGSEGLSGNEAIDKIMSDLLKVVKRHNVWLGLISHLRKAMGGKSFEEGNLASIDDIKGSGSIKQISFDIIAFARNLVAEDEHERNTIKLRVLKSRFTGRTGDAGTAVYDPATTRLSAASDVGLQDFTL